MERKSLILAVTIVCLTGFLVAKQLVFSTDRQDLFFHKKFVDADDLWEPAPGKLYAIHQRNGRFDSAEVCQAENARNDAIAETGYVGKNLIGLNYNSAVANLPETVLKMAPGLLMAQHAERFWPLYAQHNSPTSLKFNPDCQKTVTKKFWDQAYYVFQVETVYFTTPEKTDPFMVKFKSSPMLVSECDQACRDKMPILDELLTPRFFTRLKRNVIDVDKTVLKDAT
ncbi:hypothetical protein QEZ52_06150 [Aliisedimentitalea scapharcae]|uniref:Uncharacterized protein n=1 Tax=Aliisedimentitalea scapharcae TaxID=1524259 RepID=A0ABZ2XXK4_9RHOB|nr:hypothetical protein K3727_06055 [Rhodobacteraceae bacterium M382]